MCLSPRRSVSTPPVASLCKKRRQMSTARTKPSPASWRVSRSESATNRCGGTTRSTKLPVRVSPPRVNVSMIVRRGSFSPAHRRWDRARITRRTKRTPRTCTGQRRPFHRRSKRPHATLQVVSTVSTRKRTYPAPEATREISPHRRIRPSSRGASISRLRISRGKQRALLFCCAQVDTCNLA